MALFLLENRDFLGFHHMSYNQCFDVNSERKKETITGKLI